MLLVGKKIKKLRELRNLKQDWVAEQLGLTQSGYSKIENGEVDVPVEKLEQISKILNVRPEDILTFDENMVFNVMNNKTINGFVIYNTSEYERKLHDEQVKNLKDEIQYLKGVLDKLLKK